MYVPTNQGRANTKGEKMNGENVLVAPLERRLNWTPLEGRPQT
jgi:hypothetical protein